MDTQLDQYEDQFLSMRVESGIFYLTYKGPLNVNSDLAENLRDKRISFLKGRRLPALVRIENSLYLDRTARKTLSTLCLDDVPAVAFVMDSYLQRMTAKLYITVIKSKPEIQFFSKITEANLWLAQYK